MVDRSHEHFTNFVSRYSEAFVHFAAPRIIATTSNSYPTLGRFFWGAGAKRSCHPSHASSIAEMPVSEKVQAIPLANSQRGFHVLLQMSSNPEVLGFILRGLLAHISKLLKLLQQRNDQMLHRNMAALLHKLLKAGGTEDTANITIALFDGFVIDLFADCSGGVRWRVARKSRPDRSWASKSWTVRCLLFALEDMPHSHPRRPRSSVHCYGDHQQSHRHVRRLPAGAPQS